MVDGFSIIGMQAVCPLVLNNTTWLMYLGVWTTYILILFFSWLIIFFVFGCSTGPAWTIVNLTRFYVIPYHYSL
ncbi:hypothetical protein AMTRI_Chr06g199330 [Amborella trichopoda]